MRTCSFSPHRLQHRNSWWSLTSNLPISLISQINVPYVLQSGISSTKCHETIPIFVHASKDQSPLQSPTSNQRLDLSFSTFIARGFAGFTVPTLRRDYFTCTNWRGILKSALCHLTINRKMLKKILVILNLSLRFLNFKIL